MLEVSLEPEMALVERDRIPEIAGMERQVVDALVHFSLRRILVLRVIAAADSWGWYDEKVGIYTVKQLTGPPMVRW